MTHKLAYNISLFLDIIGDGWNEVDFHFYRQNLDGTWSHKPGNQNVVKTDYLGYEIIDPDMSDNRHSLLSNIEYNVNLGYFAVAPLSEF